MNTLHQEEGYKNASLYSGLFDKMQPDSEIIPLLISECDPECIVEIGCGSGRLRPFYLASNAKRICGIDLEAAMVEKFATVDDPRVTAWCGDIRQTQDGIPAGSLIILTSSLLKHLPPADRHAAWLALAQSVDEKGAIYVDHCSYIYGLDRSTNWRSYCEDLQIWWPEEFWPRLSHFEWRKEVSGELDILIYRHKDGGIARIVTYAYPLGAFLADAAAVGFGYHQITDRFPGAKNLPGMERRIGLLARGSDAFWEEKARRIAAKLDALTPVDK